MPKPEWLPPLLRLEDFNGDVEKYLDEIFLIFKCDFMGSEPFFNGKKVLFDSTPENGRTAGFIHVTTEEMDESKQRTISLRRCERMGWIRPIIDHEYDTCVLKWKKKHYSHRRITYRHYLFISSEKFLVILDERRNYYFLVTAIYVDNQRQVEKHMNDYYRFRYNA